MRYRIPPVRIAHETLDGEVVILDQESGTYYSLDGAGADIWGQLAMNVSVEEISAFCAVTFEAADEDAKVDESVRGLLAELLAERLVEAIDEAAVVASAAGAATASGKRPWGAPRLERFTHLETPLLLGPIHEVGEAGGPRTGP